LRKNETGIEGPSGPASTAPVLPDAAKQNSTAAGSPAPRDGACERSACGFGRFSMLNQFNTSVLKNRQVWALASIRTYAKSRIYQALLRSPQNTYFEKTAVNVTSLPKAS
jgi:hypothetical protein